MTDQDPALDPRITSSPLYGEDLAPIPPGDRTWSMWNMAAIWVGMAVCIPTYLLASYMMTAGLSWIAALVIIGLANLIITAPMVLNGHAGVKYGIPFPVVGRSSFGTIGIHVPSIVRAVVACGWFGIQTWIGGLAFYEIYRTLFFAGAIDPIGLVPGKFIGFGLFWLLNIYFIWKGPESIKWLETFAAPILIAIGVVLIGWGAVEAGGFGNVLEKSYQLQTPTGQIVQNDDGLALRITPLVDTNDQPKAAEYRTAFNNSSIDNVAWFPIPDADIPLGVSPTSVVFNDIVKGDAGVQLQVRSAPLPTDGRYYSSIVTAVIASPPVKGQDWRTYLFWLTGMVGFWATMSLSISDITRYAKNQRDQVVGQFVGLPGAMMLYSFVGIFVTAAAIVNFGDIIIGEDAPWDPVTLLGKFDNPATVIIAQIFMIIATLSTNIAANVIAPANAFANLNPRKISFRAGGVITGIIGIAICPWWLLDEISSVLLIISGMLGPILGIMLCDYFVIRKKYLKVNDLYLPEGMYAFGGMGINWNAMIALAVGVASALAGWYIESISILYQAAWFTGFAISFVLYYFLMRPNVSPVSSV
ncbi:MAG: NCS1 family nucleobase:cation symporter-1 [Rhodothermales bacterium]|nr:NCS1 family nucleobase:cation symporter-1 [Rhodothermales bacterium]